MDGFGHALAGGFAALVGAGFGVASASNTAAADALEGARLVDLTDGANVPGAAVARGNAAIVGGAVPVPLPGVSSASPLHAAAGATVPRAAPLRAGDWIALRGEVFVDESCPALLSFDGDKVAVLEEVTQHQKRNIGDTFSHREFVERTFRDTTWGLHAGVDAGPEKQAGRDSLANGRVTRVYVERDAVRRAHGMRAISVQGLVPGGSRMEPVNTWWLPTLLKALAGYVDEGRVRVHQVLPVGVAATVLGQLDVRGGRLFIGVHPALGFYLLKDGIEVVLVKFRSTARWTGVVAGLCGAVAAWQFAKYVHVSRPGHFAALTWLFGADDQGANGAAGAGERRNASGRRGRGSPGNRSTPQRDSRDGGAGSSSSSASGSPHTAVVDPGDEPARNTEEECVICTERRRIAVLVPCGHMHTCLTCAHRLQDSDLSTDRRCPVCREPIDTVVRVFGAESAGGTACQAPSVSTMNMSAGAGSP
jgi:hypothetical protein